MLQIHKCLSKKTAEKAGSEMKAVAEKIRKRRGFLAEKKKKGG